MLQVIRLAIGGDARFEVKVWSCCRECSATVDLFPLHADLGV